MAPESLFSIFCSKLLYLTMTDDSIIDDDKINIFAEDTPKADERKQDLKHELEELCT
jgi:hypothetical protein